MRNKSGAHPGAPTSSAPNPTAGAKTADTSTPGPNFATRWWGRLKKELSDPSTSRVLPKFLRRSLAMRLGATMAGATLLILVVILLFISSHIRDGIFDQRLTQVLADASARAVSAQNRLDQATASTTEQVQSLAQDTMASALNSSSGAGGTQVLLLRSASVRTSFVINEIGSARARQLITPQMRAAVAGRGGQNWQSVALPDGEDATVPAVVVGSMLNLPLAGPHEFYLVYSLAADQDSINLMMRVLFTGSLALLILVAGMIWAVVYAVLQPVRRTVRSAERLAAGDLDARVALRGEDEMFQLAQSFNKMADSIQLQITKLNELSRLQQRFVSDVSHELRTPLTTMRIADDVIFDSKDELDPAARRSAELLHDQIERFDSMLADLLEISRIDSGGAQLDFEPLDLVEMVRAAKAETATVAQKVGAQVTVIEPGYPCTAEVDSRRVSRILRNLLVNAIEHCEGNPVQVSVDSSPTAVAVRVRDYGVGMSAEVAARVFDRFYRADPSRTRTTGGTGLGLSISLEDARLSGGDLQAWGRPGEGAAFLLTLPRTQGTEMGPSPLPLADPGMDSPAPTTMSLPGLVATGQIPVITGQIPLVPAATAHHLEKTVPPTGGAHPPVPSPVHSEPPHSGQTTAQPPNLDPPSAEPKGAGDTDPEAQLGLRS